MRIQHNIAALSAYRNLTNNNSAVSKNLEKLSSGYKINRAGDDAAGLAISEKMRAQITGLKTAQKNANDGISLVQTAEGALTEVHSMLNRMVELASQSANGTYADEVDRENLQKEIESLQDEIDRISNGTNFNGINLLDGSYEAVGATYENATSKLTWGRPAQDGSATVDPNTGMVLPTNTIVHQDSPKASKPEFTIDLSNTTTNATSTAGATSTVALQIGNTTYTYTMAQGQKLSQEELAQEFAKMINNNTTNFTAGGTYDQTNTHSIKQSDGTTEFGGVEINGVVFKATAEGKTIKFTMSDIAPTETSTPSGSAEQVLGSSFKTQGGASVSVSIVGTGLSTDSAGQLNTGTLQIQSGIVDSGVTLANSAFVIKAEDIKDGTRLTIGNTTYTFKVGQDSNVSRTEKNVVDLSDFKDNKQSYFLQTAIERLTVAAAGNDMWIVGSDKSTAFAANGGSGAITLQEVTGGYNGKNADLTTMNGIKNTIKLEQTIQPLSNANKGLTLQVGDTSDDYNKLTVSIKATDIKSLGIDGIDVSTQTGAAAALDKIKAAINTVSSIRGDLGAIQNRLEHTINNLSVTTENITAAESRIRDVDMAEEMMAYTKNNILVQASQAMLAQANQLPQGVLQLLQ